MLISHDLFFCIMTLMRQNFTPIDKLIKEYRQKKARYSSFGQKEAEPAPTYMEQRESKEKREKKEREESIPSQLKVRQETIKLPPDLKKIGVQAVDTDKFSQYQNVKIPISDDEVLIGLNKPITSSWRWLSTISIYILRMGHLALKRVHGKVVRIFKG